MVAPSFQSYTMVVAEPFTKNGKLYVTVEHPNTHNHRDVRWYTDAEYAKQYGSNKSKDESADGFAGLKVARGFSYGPILLIRNWKAADELWLGRSNARFATDVGWYIVSTEVLPADYPAHFKFLLLSWDEFRKDDDRHMKSQAELSVIIRGKERRKEYVTF